MIEPVLHGTALIDDIASARPAAGSLIVWWLGQSGFLIKSRDGLLAIDPYLSEHLTRKYEGSAHPHVRMTSAPLRGSDLTGVDLVLASHRHSDHLDPGTIPDLLAASPRAVLVVPAALRDHAIGLGVDEGRVLGIDVGETVTHRGFLVRAVPSAHERIEVDSQGRHLFLGFVIEVDGRRLYHSGDSVAYDELESHLGPEPFDVLFLPINGRDPSRGVPGNMTAAEAVALANRVRPRYVVPHHYDMFTFNTVPVGEFSQAARSLDAGVEPKVLQCGGRWEIEP